MRENQGLEVGSHAPNFQSVDLRNGEPFNLLVIARKYRGIFLNFIRNNA